MCATLTIYPTDDFHNTSIFVMLVELAILPIDFLFLGMQAINSILRNNSNARELIVQVYFSIDINTINDFTLNISIMILLYKSGLTDFQKYQSKNPF